MIGERRMREKAVIAPDKDDNERPALAFAFWFLDVSTSSNQGFRYQFSGLGEPFWARFGVTKRVKCQEATVMLGFVRKLTLQGAGLSADSIIPFAVKFMAGDVYGSEFVVGDLDAGRVGLGIEFATDLETGLCSCRADQLNDHLMADQRLSAPVAGDEGEEAMLDLVPLAGAWRQVTDGDRDIEFVGQLAFAAPVSTAAPVSRCCHRRRR